MEEDREGVNGDGRRRLGAVNTQYSVQMMCCKKRESAVFQAVKKETANVLRQLQKLYTVIVLPSNE